MATAISPPTAAGGKLTVKTDVRTLRPQKPAVPVMEASEKARRKRSKESAESWIVRPVTMGCLPFFAPWTMLVASAAFRKGARSSM